MVHKQLVEQEKLDAIFFRKYMTSSSWAPTVLPIPILFWGLGMPCYRVMAIKLVNSDHAQVGLHVNLVKSFVFYFLSTSCCVLDGALARIFLGFSCSSSRYLVP